jgi:nucleoside-diphosphate-sugar epimerase
MSFWKGKRTVVAGGAGFIGSHLVEQLVDEGAAVIVVDNMEKGSLENLKAVVGQVRVVQADLRDRKVCDDVCEGADIVMNLAARASGLGYSNSHHGEMLTANTVVGLNLLEAARIKGVRRVLVVSSACVYPDDAAVPTPEGNSLEGWPEEANQGYGWAKRVLELQASYYAQEYGMQIAIARLFNAYGPRDSWSGDKTHVIPALITKLLGEGDEMMVWGSGNQRRSFIHGRDMASGLRLLTERYAVADPVNIGDDQDISIKDLVFRLREILGVNKRVVFDTTRPEGCPRKSASMEKLRKVVGDGWPNVSLDQGLKEMVEWCLEKRLQESPNRLAV